MSRGGLMPDIDLDLGADNDEQAPPPHFSEPGSTLDNGDEEEDEG